MSYYILEGKTIKSVDNIIKWAKWFETANRHINFTEVTDKVRVSTVFLGIDHSFGSGIPILFETMIFGGEHDQYQERYATYKEAEEGHVIAVELCRGNVN